MKGTEHKITRGFAPLRRSVAVIGLVVAALSAPGLAPAPALAKSFAELPVAAPDCDCEVLVLHIGKAQVLDLPRAARDILISDPNIVETVLRTAQQPVLFGMRIGQANVLFFDEFNREIRSLEIRVEYDVAMLNRMMLEHYPNADVQAESILGEVVLTGAVASSAEAASIEDMSRRFVAASRASKAGDAAPTVNESAPGVVNRITVLNEEQVHLQVRVAEVNRSVLKRLGIDWNAGLQSTTVGTTALIRSGNISSFLTAGNSTATFGPQTLDTFLKALEQYAMVRTLAEPSLTAVSGEAASFLAGGEFPIPIARTDGETTIEFKKFGVGLDFTPVVIGDGRISLRVSTEVSDLTDNGAITIGGLTIPALSVRRADTTVEMSSGSTIMIAGLIQQDTRRLSAGLPGLRSLPVLGAFFKTEETTIDETELVVLVTPTNVRPGDPQDFVAPTDGFAPASDLDVYLFGRLHSVYGTGPQDAEAVRNRIEDVRAPVGFMME